MNIIIVSACLVGASFANFLATLDAIDDDLQMAISAINKNHYNDALKILNSIVQYRPNDSEIRYYQGVAYFNLAKIDKAIESFSASIDINPRSSKAYFERSRSFSCKSEWLRAIRDLDTASDLDPKSPGPVYLKGVFYYQSKKYEESIFEFNCAVKLAPRSPNFHLALAKVYAACPDKKFRNGKLAVELAAKARSLFNSQFDYWSLEVLAAAYAESDQFDDAIKCQKDALSILALRGQKIKARRVESRIELFENNKPLVIHSFYDW